ncbi:MAG: nucleotide exchange factor GrpE [Bdellovibrionaceae bacterium]|nr:nucleotide exchange factor GrpE [Pseudobdellovibrionaceae bacterium]
MSENQENANPGQEEGTSTTAAKLQEELTKAKNDYLYLLAEFDNYRKNAIKERSDLTKYGAERFLRDFLGVFDNFELALDSEVTRDNVESFREGVQMIAGEIRALLHRHGVDEVKAEGLPFDPNKHEALSSEPRADIPPGHVANVFKKAYKLHDKLIRPAQVTVSTSADKN